MVVKRDEDGEGHESESEVEAEESRAAVGEGCIAHEASGVNHG